MEGNGELKKRKRGERMVMGGKEGEPHRGWCCRLHYSRLKGLLVGSFASEIRRRNKWEKDRKG